MEVYFDILDNKNVVELCRFRTANHKLPIEIGRWNNTNRNNRICTHCNKNELGACYTKYVSNEEMYRDEQFSRLIRSTYSFIYVINEFT
jgi:superfamily II helicase